MPNARTRVLCWVEIVTGLVAAVSVAVSGDLSLSVLGCLLLDVYLWIALVRGLSWAWWVLVIASLLAGAASLMAGLPGGSEVARWPFGVGLLLPAFLLLTDPPVRWRGPDPGKPVESELGGGRE